MDVNNFGPFHAEVWGTVGDWASVAVNGAVVLVALHQVFEAARQQKVNTKEQRRTVTTRVQEVVHDVGLLEATLRRPEPTEDGPTDADIDKAIAAHVAMIQTILGRHGLEADSVTLLGETWALVINAGRIWRLANDGGDPEFLADTLKEEIASVVASLAKYKL